MAKNLILESQEGDLALRELTSNDVSEKYVAWLNSSITMQYTEKKYKTHTFENVTHYVKEKRKSNLEIFLGIFFHDNHVGNLNAVTGTSRFGIVTDPDHCFPSIFLVFYCYQRLQYLTLSTRSSESAIITMACFMLLIV